MYREKIGFKFLKVGRATWKFLHTLAEGYPLKPTRKEVSDMASFMGKLNDVYTCQSCKPHFYKLRK